MKIIELKPFDNKIEKEFLYLPLKIYKNDKNYILPLYKDIKTVFTPSKNPCFNFGEAKRWILQDDNQQTIGRIAAFYDKRIINVGNEQPTGAMGFFECIDNQKAANLLFDTCKEWLISKGMEAMDGPINFGDRGKWWGLLVDGFHQPNYQSNYNPPYYRHLLENYGFKDYFQQYTFARALHRGQLTPTFVEKSERLMKNPSYHFEHIQKKNIEKYVNDFRDVYNQSWAKREGVAQMTEAESRKLLKEMQPIIHEKIIWFAYYDGLPIGFVVMIPELNQYFKYVNGKMNLWGKLKFLYHFKTKKVKKILGVIIAVVPRFQKFGLESALLVRLSESMAEKESPYETGEFNWIGDFLPVMIRFYESFGCEVYKTHITYRKLFDETKEFKRHPIVK